MSLENLQVEPVVRVECAEPGGSVIREVRKMNLTPENMRTFWEQARKFKTIFNSEIRDDFQKFVKVLVTQNSDESITPNGLFWVIDDFVGVFYLTNIIPENDAQAHYTFFDGRHRGRIDLVKEMLRYAFEKYGFRRLSVEIPRYKSEKTRNFVEKSLGFRCEGKIRKSAFFDNDWYDSNIYGILREEVL